MGQDAENESPGAVNAPYSFKHFGVKRYFFKFLG